MSDETNAANLFVPHFMPEMTIFIMAPGGISSWVASVPQCMDFLDSDALLMALAALGFPFTETFSYPPFVPSAGTTFSGGLENGNVPWIVVSPIPKGTGWSASAGAFAVNAGKFANYWNHGVNPFVGSSYEIQLKEDIANRTQAAQAGQPNLG
jgi:hypothetical protein